MLIIIEGPDCARKSTLANDIAYRLAKIDPHAAIEMLHRGPPRHHPLDEYVSTLMSYHPGRLRHIICDRWHLGEAVYPQVLGRKSKMTPETQYYIELFLQARGAVTVVLTPPLEELRACLAVRGDGLITADQLPRIRALYSELRITSPTATMPSGDITPDSIIAQALGAERRALALTRFITPVGNPGANTVIFGDERNCDGNPCLHRQRHWRDGPAFMPYSATSGLYLMRALGGELPNTLFANACDVDNPLHILAQTLGSRHQRPHVVTLGVKAHDRLKSLGIRHAAVPHPQYVRRFHHAAVVEYGRLIREIIGTERNELKWRPSQLSTVS